MSEGPRSTPAGSLFVDAREALDALSNGAASTASDQGIDTVGSLSEEVRKALDAGLQYRDALREIIKFDDSKRDAWRSGQHTSINRWLPTESAIEAARELLNRV